MSPVLNFTNFLLVIFFRQYVLVVARLVLLIMVICGSPSEVNLVKLRRILLISSSVVGVPALDDAEEVWRGEWLVIKVF